MGLGRFPRQTEGTSTDRFSCFHKPGISDELPKLAASKSWDIFHIDPKTAFLQGQSYGVNRYVVCQLPPEAGHPRYIAARLKKPAYGMNDAPRRWWNILDTELRSYGMVPTRAARCCYVLYSHQTCKQNWNKTCSTQGHGTNDISLESRARSEGDAAFEKMLEDPIEGSPATGNSVAGIVNLFVDDLFRTGGTEMEQRVLAGLKKRISKLVQKTGMMSFSQEIFQ